MKTKITSICFALMLLLGSLSAEAKIFYVISGKPFQLKPDVATLFQYKWLDNGADVPVGEIGAQGVLSKTFTLTNATVAETKTLSLGVLDAAGGCVSTLINHTIVVLPQLGLAVVPLVDNFCTNVTAISTEITASLIGSVPDLSTFGVTLGTTYKWFKDGTLIAGQTGNKITVTDVGTYKSEIEYILPTTGSYIPDASKIADAIIGSADIKKDRTAPSTPDIQLL